MTSETTNQKPINSFDLAFGPLERKLRLDSDQDKCARLLMHYMRTVPDLAAYRARALPTSRYAHTVGDFMDRLASAIVDVPPDYTYSIKRSGGFVMRSNIDGLLDFLNYTEDQDYIFGFNLSDLRWGCEAESLLDCIEPDPKQPKLCIGEGTPEEVIAMTGLPWFLREQYRMRAGITMPVTWKGLEPIPGHYLHASQSVPGMVAYTENAVKGERDIQVRTKPGRYLTKFYPHLSGDEVRDYAAQIGKMDEVFFASSTEDIVRVYENGPSSCMSHSADDYDSEVHPVSVYGESDLQVAYVMDGAGNINGRCLVWPERKLWGRMYGDVSRLRAKLEHAGFRSGDLRGAKIRKIWHSRSRNQVVMPYIDGCRSFGEVDDKWLKIGGNFSGESTDGTAYLHAETTCERCEERVSEDEVSDVEGQSWCEECRNHHSWTSDYSDDVFSDDTSRINVIGRYGEEWWSQDEADDHAFLCDGSGEYYSRRHHRSVEMENGETWSQDYFDDHGVTVDGVNYRQGDEPQKDDEGEFVAENTEAASKPEVPALIAAE